MGLFSRLAHFLNIRGHAALDKAEEPAQVLDYAYRQQLEQLQQFRRAITDVVTNEKRLELQQAQLVTKVDTLTMQARQALQADREDLARLALERKETFLAQLATYEQQIAQLQEQKERLLSMERKLSASIEAFRTQKEMVKAQYTAAKAQVQVQEMLTGISQDMNETNMAMQRAQDKILTMQARAQALDTMIEQGSLDQPALAGSDSNSYLDRELRQLSTQQNVETQLQAMKQQLQLSGPDTDQAQIEGPAT